MLITPTTHTCIRTRSASEGPSLALRVRVEHPSCRADSRRRGAAAVEFALVSPLIFLLFFASIEFGRLLMVTHALDTAAREGCRKAVSWDVDSENIEQVVTARLATCGISRHSLDVEPSSPAGANQWDPITVRIAVPYGEVSWLPVPRYLAGITLRGSCTLPKESDAQER